MYHKDKDNCVTVYDTAIVFNSACYSLIAFGYHKCDIELINRGFKIILNKNGKYKINRKGKRINNPKIRENENLPRGKFYARETIENSLNVIIVSTYVTAEKSKKRDVVSPARRRYNRFLDYCERASEWENNPKG